MSPLAHNQEFLERGGGGGLVAKLCLTLCDPVTVSCQSPLSMGFSKQEYWDAVPFPSPPEDLPDSGFKLASLVSLVLAGGFFSAGTTWEALSNKCENKTKFIFELAIIR